MHTFNLFTGPLTLDEDDPTGYAGRYARVSDALGARELALKLFELPPGQSVCPYHYEYAEEWLVVLDGRPTIRHPDGEQIADAGDVVCFSAGPDGAHKVTNESSSETVRVIMFSSAGSPRSRSIRIPRRSASGPATTPTGSWFPVRREWTTGRARHRACDRARVGDPVRSRARVGDVVRWTST